MNDIDNALQQLIEAVLKSDIYQGYDRERNRVKKIPSLKQEIDEYRKTNYILQNVADCDFKRIDEFERQHTAFREIPEVADFLAAELAFCRLVQELNIRFTEAMNFE